MESEGSAPIFQSDSPILVLPLCSQKTNRGVQANDSVKPVVLKAADEEGT